MASAATIAAVHATATASSTTPSTTTTTTADKYDRQLRVWGADGQRQLRDTCVVLIQATAAGTETLKNLVLPGVGAYTVVDDYSCVGRKNVAGAATASAERPPVYTGQCNFFVDEAPRNATATAPCTTPISRAESAGTLLQELNPDVQGSWCHVPDIEAKNMDWTTMLQRAAHVEGWKSTMDHADGNTNDTLCMVRTSSAPAQVDSTTPAWTTRHLLVVASDLPLVVVDRVAAACRATSTTQLLVVQSYGLVGTVRWAYVPPTVVLQPRTTAPPEWGLTLGCVASTAAKDDSGAGNNNNNNRFEALEALVDETEQQWDGLSDRDRGHVPFPILLKVVQRQFCKKNNSGQLPRTADEKRAFVEMVKALGRPRDATNNGATATTSTTATLNTNDLPLNVQQAVQHAYTAYTERPLDMDRLRALQCTLVDASSNTSSASNTRHVARLLTSLLDTSYLADRHGQPPLQGSIPDLASSTDWYMRLQTVYRQRAAEDVAALAAAAASTTSGDGTEDTIPTDVVQAVCQNLRHLTVTDVPYVPSDATVSEAVGAALVEAATDDAEDGDEHVAQQSPLLWYVAVQAGHVFYQRHGRYPGTRPVGKDDQDNDDTMDDTDTNEDDPTFLQDDVQKLHPCLVDTVARYRLDQCSVVTEALLSHGNDTKNTNPYAQEIVRWGHADLHTIASVVGGVAAQEAVKGVTGQYVPLDTTYVYNGIASRGGVYPV